MYIIYGIPNCDTIKKALAWLKANGIEYLFYDYKKNGIPTSKLSAWSKQVGWESLLNKKGTTWRKLDASVQESITSEKKAISLLAENTSAIKRPLIEKDNKVVALGFDELVYKKLFKK
jgi:Spx/MgsR family transcriptional regulator